MPHNLGSFFDTLRGGPDLRAASIERLLRLLAPKMVGQQGPTADPEGASAAIRHSLDRGTEVTTGRVVDGVAYTHMYKVQLDQAGPVLPCCDLVHTALGIVGAKQLNTYTPGTPVVVLTMHQVEYGVILGALPDFGINAFSALPDMVGQGSGVGLRADDIHKFPFQLDGRGGVADWSCGRPFDSLTVGEWGAVTETGLMVFLDPFLGMLRADEETGLWVFYQDSTTRLAGHNLQIRSAGHELEALDDQGEYSWVEGWAPFLYEARGLLEPGDPFQDVSVDASQQDAPYLATLEPTANDQQPFHRRQDFHGYLGQGGRRSLCVPASGASNPCTYGDEVSHMGVAEENWGLDGFIGLRSAKGILIAKRALLPHPKRVCRPEDPAGDSDTSGYDFSGASHKVADLPDADLSRRSLIQAADLEDVLARTFNWQGLHPFAYHQLDWYTPEENACPLAGAMAASPPFDTLVDVQYLALPTPMKVTVDARYGSVAYYPNDSFFGLLDDGGVVLSGGCGEELVMAHGSIFLRAPGDIWTLPGKSAITWAGWDIIHKANNCVEVVANWGDVRIKAERNVLILGGNDGCGGVMIESKASGTAFRNDKDDTVITGVVLRAPDSSVAVLTDKLFNVLPASVGGYTEIRLQAGGGLILAESDVFYRRLYTAAVDDFGGTANEFRGDTTQLGSGLGVYGDIASWRHITENVTKPIHDRQDIVLESIAAAGLEARLTWLPDHSDVQTVGFFFRSSKLAHTEGLVLYEGRWQRLARLTGQEGVSWDDNLVSTAGGDITRAHPGRQTWEDETGYTQQDFVVYDPGSGLYADRVASQEPSWPTHEGVDWSAFMIITNPEGV